MLLLCVCWGTKHNTLYSCLLVQLECSKNNSDSDPDSDYLKLGFGKGFSGGKANIEFKVAPLKHVGLVCLKEEEITIMININESLGPSKI